MKIARIVAVWAGFAIALCAWAEVRAGTLPNLSGTWYANGNPAKHCHFSQSGSSISLTNERGATATGNFLDAGSLVTNWGPFGGGQITGRISSDLRTITWSNGTYWSRPSGFVPPAPVAASTTPTPNPYRNLRWGDVGRVQGPIEVFQGWSAVKRDGSIVYACISFRNTSSVAATRIRFDFPLLNKSEHVIDTARLDRRGTFSPNIAIHGWGSITDWASGSGHRGYSDNCVTWKPDDEAEASAFSRLQFFIYRVERVEFADGTTWPRPSEPPPSP